MRRLRKTALASLAIVAVTLTVGCGAPSDTTPAACLNGPGVYERALRVAPGAVTLPGGVPISDCLAENQQAGDLARVGESMVVAATELNRIGREAPRGPASLQLGYLVGAAERGAEGTGGIHADLIRRLNSAARTREAGSLLPFAYLRRYESGYAAGRENG